MDHRLLHNKLVPLANMRGHVQNTSQVTSATGTGLT
jgi:hypothetical protein